MNVTNIFLQLKRRITSNRGYLVSKARERIGKFWELEKLAEDERLKFVEDLLYKDRFNCKPNPDKEVRLSILYAKVLQYNLSPRILSYLIEYHWTLYLTYHIGCYLQLSIPECKAKGLTRFCALFQVYKRIYRSCMHSHLSCTIGSHKLSRKMACHCPSI